MELGIYRETVSRHVNAEGVAVRAVPSPPGTGTRVERRGNGVVDPLNSSGIPVTRLIVWSDDPVLDGHFSGPSSFTSTLRVWPSR